MRYLCSWLRHEIYPRVPNFDPGIHLVCSRSVSLDPLCSLPEQLRGIGYLYGIAGCSDGATFASDDGKLRRDHIPAVGGAGNGRYILWYAFVLSFEYVPHVICPCGY